MKTNEIYRSEYRLLNRESLTLIDTKLSGSINENMVIASYEMTDKDNVDLLFWSIKHIECLADSLEVCDEETIFDLIRNRQARYFYSLFEEEDEYDILWNIAMAFLQEEAEDITNEQLKMVEDALLDVYETDKLEASYEDVHNIIIDAITFQERCDKLYDQDNENYIYTLEDLKSKLETEEMEVKPSKDIIQAIKELMALPSISGYYLLVIDFWEDATIEESCPINSSAEIELAKYYIY